MKFQFNCYVELIIIIKFTWSLSLKRIGTRYYSTDEQTKLGKI